MATEQGTKGLGSAMEALESTTEALESATDPATEGLGSAMKPAALMVIELVKEPDAAETEPASSAPEASWVFLSDL